MKDTIWRCRNGTLVLVSLMADRHLHNILAMMDRKPSWRREYRDRLELEVVIRKIRGRP